MPLKCCVPRCNGNYDSTKQRVPVYRFPKDEAECSKWIKAIPRSNLKVTKYTVVCRKHWPNSTEFKSVHGKEIPVVPPSVFENIPKSCLVTSSPQPRITTKALPSSRNQEPDEIDLFLKQDAIDFSLLEQKLHRKKVVTFTLDQTVVIQSAKLIEGIPLFLIKIHEDYLFETFHLGSVCIIQSLAANKVRHCKTWSCLDEIIRFLSSKQICHKKEIMVENLKAMGTKKVGQKLYSPSTILQAFEYFATSRALYSKLVKDYPLPSVRTLTRITSKVDKIDDISFFKNVLKYLPPEKRCCNILIDEVYIKPSMSFHGGKVFGKALDNPEKLAKTICCIMVKCLYGGPEFIVKLLPVANLTADFLYSQFNPIAEAIKEVENAKVLAIITDGQQVNQKLFRQLNTSYDEPWLGADTTFLMFDYVHLLKCIRNNWLSEKCGQLQFSWDGNSYTAKWEDLKQLFQCEAGNLLRLSKLTYKAVYPSPIEKQNVTYCLQVFCDETIAALETCSQTTAANDTILFLKLIVKFWKIVNVHNKGTDVQLNDERRAVISSADDERLSFLQNLAAMAEGMTAGNRHHRMKQLTKETGTMFAHICKGFVNLAKYLLLDKNVTFVLFGWFSTDPLEKYFSKLRQGSGGTYFINAQSVLQKVAIYHAKLALRMDFKLDDQSSDQHQCTFCNRKLTYQESEVLDNLYDLEEQLSDNTLNAMVYIGGYIENKQAKSNEDTTFYYDRYGQYLNNLNRGKLTIPDDSTVQWIVYCFIFFVTLSTEVCRNFLLSQFISISNKFNLSMNTKHARILANIFLKNDALLKTPRSSRETGIKILKLA